MLDNQEEEILDKEEVLDEEQAEVQEEPQEEELVPHYDPTSAAYKCCHEALKRQTSLVFLWAVFLIVFLGGIVALFASQVLSFQGNKKEATITLIPYASVATMAIIAKIVALMRNQAYYTSEKENYLTALPEEPNRLIQDFYLLQQCRKCSQYWITLIMVFISVFTAVYCVIVSAILKLAGVGGSSALNMGMELGFGKDTVAGLTTISLLTIPVWFLCYQFASSRTNDIIKGLEATYPKEKIIDCSLCRHKLEASNKKKKLIAFGVVVTLGFFIYFFFKRFTCTLFEKSFEF